jgi:hypothetical protein
MDAYLPKETLAWCHNQLSLHNIDLGSLSSADIEAEHNEDDEYHGARVHVRAYHTLRNLVAHHIESGSTPRLSLYPKPEGSYRDIEARGGLLAEIIASNASVLRQGVHIEDQLESERRHIEEFEQESEEEPEPNYDESDNDVME